VSSNLTASAKKQKISRLWAAFLFLGGSEIRRAGRTLPSPLRIAHLQFANGELLGAPWARLVAHTFAVLPPSRAANTHLQARANRGAPFHMPHSTPAPKPLENPCQQYPPHASSKTTIHRQIDSDKTKLSLTQWPLSAPAKRLIHMEPGPPVRLVATTSHQHLSQKHPHQLFYADQRRLVHASNPKRYRSAYESNMEW
jgi:hypothetical protein